MASISFFFYSKMQLLYINIDNKYVILFKKFYIYYRAIKLTRI